MRAKNQAELERMLKRDLLRAMKAGSKKILEDLYESAGEFYTGTDPKMYERTGALGDTPMISDIYDGGKEISFTAGFDDTGKYTTGKNPTMHDVLDLADKGITNSSVGILRPAVGNMGFVESSENKIEKTMDTIIGNAFN